MSKPLKTVDEYLLIISRSRKITLLEAFESIITDAIKIGQEHNLGHPDKYYYNQWINQISILSKQDMEYLKLKYI